MIGWVWTIGRVFLLRAWSTILIVTFPDSTLGTYYFFENVCNEFENFQTTTILKNLTHGVLKNLSHKVHTKFTQSSHEVHTKFTQSSHKVATNSKKQKR